MKSVANSPYTQPSFSAGQRGNALVMMLIALPALIGAAGLALDWGRGVWTRTRLQKAADAAALGGASFLPNTSLAADRASELAEQNFPGFDWVTFNPSGNDYEVQMGVDVPTFFMRIFGHDTMQVRVDATARVRVPVGTLRGRGFPFALINPNLNGDPTDDLVPSNYGRAYILEYGEPNINVQDWANGSLPYPKGGGSQGWRSTLGLRFDGTYGNAGASDIRDDLRYGWPGTMHIGDQVPIKEGNMSGPAEQGRQDLLGSDPLPWTQFNPRVHGEISRVVFVPVVHLVHATRGDTYTIADFNNGADWSKQYVVVDGFAPFFLLKEPEQRPYLQEKGSTSDWMVGLFVPGVEAKNFLPPGAGQADFGLYAPPRLVD